MLAVIRIILLGIFVIFASVFGILFCLIRPFHRNNVYWLGKTYCQAAKILGIKLDIRTHPDARKAQPAVFIANHQNSYDIFTLCGSVLPSTVTIGKKSLKWIPFFGQLYWLSGNILIDRENRKKALAALKTSKDIIQKRKVSVWMFPEGTRSYGRGLLPFKRGAFQLAQAAGVPIVPVLMSTTCNKIKLNRWSNGTVIIEVMAPTNMTEAQQKNLKQTCEDYHAMMSAKLQQLDAEADQLNAHLLASNNHSKEV
ncbi:1-acyl-sn-glycerol-3-phosphate acyltransferase [Catenovulum agarivorans DS-2]|uniref:1-acyl-sn-glycerol-3-phosphate acyltransferase n=1 Tax=Catenovulum agarivorans DS-2 TaxID=1328313 RepID=W7QCS7_9ALTE|nr:1-acylglycerol-3-phosphate O-acyltransferase [Catenovulum agarivorans]EWH09721.1 1-acyl-sn-glycerol-3-phosphate acyltransferase [Catenovulum agarivorans DS-2]